MRRLHRSLLQHDTRNALARSESNANEGGSLSRGALSSVARAPADFPHAPPLLPFA